MSHRTAFGALGFALASLSLSPAVSLADQCALTFARGAGPALLAYGFEVDYSSSGATPAGSVLVDCNSAGPAISVVGIVTQPGTLSVQLSGVPESIPVGDIVRCNFDVGPGETVSAGDFGVTTTLAVDTQGMVVSPPPAASISNVACGAAATTTTTTLGATTTTSMGFGSTTSTTMVSRECTVVLDYIDNATLGGFVVDVGYSPVGDGRFALIRGTLTPECTPTPPFVFDDFGFNDNTATNELNVSWAAQGPPALTAPAEIVRCRFLPGQGPQPPTAADFNPMTRFAAGPGGQPLGSLPDFEVTDVICSGFTGGTTTTTTMPGGGGICGDPVDPGPFAASLPRLVTASDALLALNAAVGLASCELCVCDVDSSGGVTAADALRILTAAVGGATALACPPCAA